jgi:hypothetical protein
MNFRRVPVRSLAASLCAIFLLSAAAYAKGNSAFPNVHIKNFGQMEEQGPLTIERPLLFSRTLPLTRPPRARQ